MRNELFQERITRDGPIDLIVHPSLGATSVIVNMPGYRGDIDGFNMKYRVLGAHLAKLGIGAFIQMPNILRSHDTYRWDIVQDAHAVCDYALSHARKMCATDKPDIFLMGFSAGAGAVAAVAGDYSSVKKVLLMAPSGDAAYDMVTASLAKFTGEVYAVIGSQDTIVGPGAAQVYLNLASRASAKHLVVIDNCDHQFRGTVNGKIMSKAPLWAFAGDKTFPSPEGGLVLY